MSGSQARSGSDSNDAPAFLFDFDGTLIDSVYQHVLAWHEALLKAGIELSVWRVHRRIGMSEGLMVNALSRETNRRLTQEEATQIQQWHAEAYLRQLEQVRPLPGARDLLGCLSRLGVRWAIATSGRMLTAGPNLTVLGMGSDQTRSRCVPSRGRTAKCSDYFLGGSRRQRVGLARRTSGWSARSRTIVGRIRQRRTGERRRIPCVQRSSRSALAPG